MATSAQTLIDRTRRFLRDWPSLDSLTTSITSTATTLVVADSSVYKANWTIELDNEVIRVKALPAATSLTVARAQLGSTAATHAAAASILVQPSFFAIEVLDALNYGLDMTFPLLYKEVLDTSLTILTNGYEYTIPNMASPATPIPRLAGVELLWSGDYSYRRVDDWEVRRGSTPKLKFRHLYTPGATIRLRGYGPFPHLASMSDTIDPQYPYQAEMPLIEFAASYLLESGEARRVRVDTGPIDVRENANRTGSSMQASAAILNRFERSLLRAAMPPLPPHVVSTI